MEIKNIKKEAPFYIKLAASFFIFMFLLGLTFGGFNYSNLVGSLIYASKITVLSLVVAMSFPLIIRSFDIVFGNSDISKTKYVISSIVVLSIGLLFVWYLFWGEDYRIGCKPDCDEIPADEQYRVR